MNQQFSENSIDVDLQVDNLWHSYPAQPEPLLALEDVNLAIRPGEFVSVVGVSGCGKSTLLRLLAGLLDPTRGSVRLAGQSPAAMRANKQISWMAQQAALLPWRTVLENVTLPLRINKQAGAGAEDGHGRPATATVPAELLQLVGLADFAHVYPHTLSGGMQQRVALARALATGASLWLMDEPFAALDELTRALLASELLHIWRHFRPTVLWVTHNMHEAIRLSNRVVVMTPRPGTIAGEVAVPLRYPRDDTSVDFQEVLREARRLLGTGGEIYPGGRGEGESGEVEIVRTSFERA